MPMMIPLLKLIFVLLLMFIELYKKHFIYNSNYIIISVTVTFEYNKFELSKNLRLE